MVGIALSCDPEKLRKVLVASRAVMSRFYGLTREDKEEIEMQVVYRFEMDKARFPVTVYARHCRNKIIGFLSNKTAQKRMLSQMVNGKRVYIQDVSLNMTIEDDDDTELLSIIPDKESDYTEVELLLVIEQKAPELVPLAKRVLSGDTLTKEERNLLRRSISKKDLVE